MFGGGGERLLDAVEVVPTHHHIISSKLARGLTHPGHRFSYLCAYCCVSIIQLSETDQSPESKGKLLHGSSEHLVDRCSNKHPLDINDIKGAEAEKFNNVN